MNESLLEIHQYKKIFDITANMNLETDLQKYTVDSEDQMDVFALFKELVELILENKENDTEVE